MNIDVLSLDQNDAANAEESIRATYDVSGTNIMVMVDDDGRLRNTHQEFQNAHGVSRVDNQYVSAIAIGGHANHVAGTIGARGAVPAARGVAPDCSMVVTEGNMNNYASSPSTYVTRVRANDVAASNHSWGGYYGEYKKIKIEIDVDTVEEYTYISNPAQFINYHGSVLTPSDEFLFIGKYNEHTQRIDRSLYDVSTSTLSVWAAGNSRNHEFILLGTHVFNGTTFTNPFIFGDLTGLTTLSQVKNIMYSTSTETITVDGVNRLYRYFEHPKSGASKKKYYLPEAVGNSRTEKFDVLNPTQVTKNSLVVGSVGLATRNSSVIGADPLTTTPLSNLSLFSSTGPTDDGRIKPELVADGSGVYGVSGGAINAYTYKTGTSMAAPVVTGCAALVNQMYRKRTGKTKMPAAMAKAVLIANAYRGNELPNHATGYGMVDASKSLGFLSAWDNSNNANPNYVYLEEKTFTTPGTDMSFAVYPRATDVSTSILLCWTDPPATDSMINTDRHMIDASHTMIVNKLRVECVEDVTNDAKRTYYPWYLNVNNPSAAARNEVQAGVRDSVYGIDAPYDNTKLIEFTARNTNKHVVKISLDSGQSQVVPSNATGQDYTVLMSGAAAEAIPIRVRYVGTSSPFFEFYQNSTKLPNTPSLVRGNTYKFIIEIGHAGHPFWIGGEHRGDPNSPAKIVNSTPGKSRTSGLVNADEYITVYIPSTYPIGSTLKYYCTAHPGMINSFVIEDPPAAVAPEVALAVVSAVADPYVYPVFSSAPYKLPDAEATYCMYHSSARAGGPTAQARVRLDVYARVERASPDHQRRMRRHADAIQSMEGADASISREDVVTDGYFFRWVVVRIGDSWIHVNMATRDVQINRRHSYRLERREKRYTTKHFEEPCEYLRIWFTHQAFLARDEPSYLDVMFFENPHLENGLELAPFSLSADSEEKDRGRYGLLMRPPDDAGFLPEREIFEQETWHYKRSVVRA